MRWCLSLLLIFSTFATMAMSFPPGQVEILRGKCVYLSQARNENFVLVTGKLIAANTNLLPADCFPGAQCYQKNSGAKAHVIVQGQLSNSNVAGDKVTISFALDASDSDTFENIEKHIGANVGFCGVRKEQKKSTNAPAYNVPDNTAFMLLSE